MNDKDSAMNIGYCKDCRYWDRYEELCNRVNWVEKHDAIEPNAMAYYAYASNDQGLDAGIKTGPMFGCIQFEAKKLTR